MNPTLEPTTDPTEMTLSPTTMPTAAPVITYDVDIVIAIVFEVTNASDAEIRDLVLDLLLDEIYLVLPDATDGELDAIEQELDSQTTIEVTDTDGTLYTVTSAVTLPDETSADRFVALVEGAAFAADLEQQIESETNNVVA